MRRRHVLVSAAKKQKNPWFSTEAVTINKVTKVTINTITNKVTKERSNSASE